MERIPDRYRAASENLIGKAHETSAEMGTQIKDTTVVAGHGLWQLISNIAHRLQKMATGPTRSERTRAFVQKAAKQTLHAGRAHPGRVAGTAAGAVVATVALRRRMRRSAMTGPAA